MKQRKKGIIYTSITIAAILLGSWYWYWKANQPRFCDENMIEVSERQLKKEVKKQLFTQKDFDGLFELVSEGRYILYGKIKNCRIPQEVGAYYASFSFSHRGNHGLFHISSVPVKKHSNYQSVFQIEQIDQNQDLLIEENFVFWKTAERYYLLKARTSGLDILRNANIFGEYNEIVADLSIRKIPLHNEAVEQNFPYMDRWIKQSSNALKLSFNFQKDGTFMANYAKSDCCINIFNGSYTINDEAIKLDFDMGSQSAINSSELPFSWDGVTLKMQVDGIWQEFEAMEKK